MQPVSSATAIGRNVDTTTTERLRPSGPRVSRNSPTSRPRSPISASTVISAAVPRAIMPISVLLPTPLPPKIPIRWPRPQVRKPSTARTPQPIGSLISVRSSACGAAPSIRRDLVARYSPSESNGWPAASITLPSISGPTRSDGRAPQVTIWSPNRIPCGVSRIIESTLEPRNPTISPGNLRPAESMISHDSPTEQNGPEDSTRLPTTSVTRPVQRMVELLRSQFT